MLSLETKFGLGGVGQTISALLFGAESGAYLPAAQSSLFAVAFCLLATDEIC